MGPIWGKLVKRPMQTSRAGAQLNTEQEDERIESTQKLRTRAVGERRSKYEQDKRWTNTEKGKMKGQSTSPVPKKRKSVQVQDVSSSEDMRGRSRKTSVEAMEVELSGRSGTPKETDKDNDDEQYDEFEDVPAPVPRLQEPRCVERLHEGGALLLLKLVMVDVTGNPYGPMKASLAEDVRKMARELDPTRSWDAQPNNERRRFFTRLYTEWDVQSPDKKTKKIIEKWLKPLITKSLINYRWKLNQLIDSGKRRPPEVTREYWNTLVANRKTDFSRKKSEQMRSISAGKGSKVSQLRSIEKDALIKLSIALKCAPYDSELRDEVAREFSRQEEMKRTSPVDHGRDLEDVRSRLEHFEASMARMVQNMESMQQRIEDVFGQLLTGPRIESSLLKATLFTAPSSPNVNVPSVLVEDPMRQVAVEKRGTGSPGSARTELLQGFTDAIVHMDSGAQKSVMSASSEEKEAPGSVVEHVVQVYDKVVDAAVDKDGHREVDPYAMSENTRSNRGSDVVTAEENTHLPEKPIVDSVGVSPVRAETRVVKTRPMSKINCGSHFGAAQSKTGVCMENDKYFRRDSRETVEMALVHVCHRPLIFDQLAVHGEC